MYNSASTGPKGGIDRVISDQQYRNSFARC
jgi:hypothetical protein